MKKYSVTDYSFFSVYEKVLGLDQSGLAIFQKCFVRLLISRSISSDLDGFAQKVVGLSMVDFPFF